MNQSAIYSALPRFTLNGEPRSDFSEAILQVTVQLPLAGQSKAELRLQNWGPTDSRRGEPEFRFNELDFGDELEIHIGEESEVPLFSGQIIGIEERYDDTPPQISIFAEDKLHHLARQRHSRSFEDTSLNDLVQQIADEAGLEADIDIDNMAGQWLQFNESNLALLQRLLIPIGIWPRLENGMLRTKPEATDKNPVEVSAYQNALKVQLIADLNHQALETSIFAYDFTKDEAVESRYNRVGGKPLGATGAQTLKRLGWEGDSVLTQPFATNKDYADLLARNGFQSEAGCFLHGEVICNGTPELRSGKELRLLGVSERLAGTYRVVHCIQLFDLNNGYQTRANINRSYWKL